MSTICPSVTDTKADPHEYRLQIERIAGFAERIHIDLMDSLFASSKSINPAQVWWPDGMVADIHLMFKKPLEYIETLVSLQPHLVIIHSEAEGDILAMLKHLQKYGIKSGVCLLQSTTVESVAELVKIADHTLLFSGDLGYFGGSADLKLLDKVSRIRDLHPSIEIGWDGGANEQNVASLSRGGIDVINVGGAIQRADDPEAAYGTLISNSANV